MVCDKWEGSRAGGQEEVNHSEQTMEGGEIQEIIDDRGESSPTPDSTHPSLSLGMERERKVWFLRIVTEL